MVVVVCESMEQKNTLTPTSAMFAAWFAEKNVNAGVRRALKKE